MRDVPTRDLKGARVNHRKKVLHGQMHIFKDVRLRIELIARMNGTTLGERPIEVGAHRSGFSLPFDVELIGKYARN